MKEKMITIKVPDYRVRWIKYDFSNWGRLMNDIEKLLKEKLVSQGIDKAWLDNHFEVLTDDEDNDDE